MKKIIASNVLCFAMCILFIQMNANCVEKLPRDFYINNPTNLEISTITLRITKAGDFNEVRNEGYLACGKIEQSIGNALQKYEEFVGPYHVAFYCYTQSPYYKPVPITFRIGELEVCGWFVYLGFTNFSDPMISNFMNPSKRNPNEPKGAVLMSLQITGGLKDATTGDEISSTKFIDKCTSLYGEPKVTKLKTWDGEETGTTQTLWKDDKTTLWVEYNPEKKLGFYFFDNQQTAFFNARHNYFINASKRLRQEREKEEKEKQKLIYGK